MENTRDRKQVYKARKLQKGRQRMNFSVNILCKEIFENPVFCLALRFLKVMPSFVSFFSTFVVVSTGLEVELYNG